MSKLYDDRDRKNLEKAEAVVRDQLPDFAAWYFRDSRDVKTPGSLLGYAVDLAAFFKYVSETRSADIKDITIKMFASVTASDIEDYIESSRYCNRSGDIRSRSNAALCRRFSVLRSFYLYYFENGYIPDIPVLKVRALKLKKSRSRIPSNEEISDLLDFVANGSMPSGYAACYQEHVRKRDTALLTLIAGAGLKASECIRLNIQDVDLNSSRVVINSRKNNNAIHISSHIRQVLSEYMAERLCMIAEYGHDDALFLSLQMKRISDDAIELLTKKYTAALFGGEAAIRPKDLQKAFRENAFDLYKDPSIVSALTGSHPDTIRLVYRAELDVYYAQEKPAQFVAGTK